MKARRLEEMESLIARNGSLSMEELRDTFGVSMNTVRRDVADLVERGRVRKVYGGVQSMQHAALIPYEERSARASEAKRQICRRAAELVRDGDIVFIDSGTTTEHLMDLLQDRTLTVITNNIEILLRAMDHPNIRLIVLPGELRRDTHSITGEATAAYLSNYNTNIAFMAATGVSMGGVTNSSPLEYAIKESAVKHTEKAVLLVTGPKFGITSLLTYAKLTDFDTVITDSRIPGEWKEQLAELQVRAEIVPDA